MKKFFVLAAIATVAALPVFARNGETTAAAHFNADFKGATGVWNSGKMYNEVLYFWHGTLMDAFYDLDGNLIGVFHDVDASALPAKSADNIKNWYKGYEVKEITMMEKDGQDPVYFVSIESATHARVLQVSKDGQVDPYKNIR